MATHLDLWSLYSLMLKSRMFEEAVAQLWHDGLISGEMHLGTGEEAIVAGIVSHLHSDDAMALDHRGTPPLLLRGVDPAALLHEMLGHPDGLCRGMGGHMHLYAKDYLAASSGIVGASGPTAVGFAIAARYLRPGSLAVSFFGEAALNQGMLMESMNLAAAWNLPVLFVCKDDNWGITTGSDDVTGGGIADRGKGLGVPVSVVDGRDVEAVWQTARIILNRIRKGAGPQILQAHCTHLDGHFLGYQMMRIVKKPIRELPPVALPLARSFLRRGGAPLSKRLSGLKIVLGAILDTLRDQRRHQDNDPIHRLRGQLDGEDGRLREIEANVISWLDQVLAAILSEAEA